MTVLVLFRGVAALLCALLCASSPTLCSGNINAIADAKSNSINSIYSMNRISSISKSDTGSIVGGTNTSGNPQRGLNRPWRRVAGLVGRRGLNSLLGDAARAVGSEAVSCAQHIASAGGTAEAAANALDVCRIHWKPLVVLGYLPASGLADWARRDSGTAYRQAARAANDKKWASFLQPPSRR
jgi:hypothetical protein